MIGTCLEENRQEMGKRFKAQYQISNCKPIGYSVATEWQIQSATRLNGRRLATFPVKR
jgi:hypothetical protein